ncbi:MAG: hypothetical protein A2583_09095 [Bdellovibrionales bacterium RIFOXYD1_FULL_53_11]|nr:MAG: hypothetical protein A2583_09095 [Bdellovibrionales bacterium RIFOXYD1_FULL_53_11]
MLPPVFIKGQLVLAIDGGKYKFTNVKIAESGVSGLPWGTLSSRAQTGKKGYVLINHANETLKMAAVIMTERTRSGETMGLRFLPGSDNAPALRETIARNGFYPTDYMRKYPRIPAATSVQTFPLHVLASIDDTQIIFDVSNLSPSGILIATQSALARSIVPGHRIALTLDPRGWFPRQIHVTGLVCRIIEDIDLASGNTIYHLGIKFTRVDEVNKMFFLDLLRDILEKIRPASSK